MLKFDIGFLFKRKDIEKITFSDLLRELDDHILEISLIGQTLSKLKNLQLKTFDSSTGDWKCQTRASFIVNLNPITEVQEYSNLSKNLISLFNNVNSLNSGDRQKFGKDNLQNTSFYKFLLDHKLTINIQPSLLFISACFITTKINNIDNVFQKHLTKNKFKNLINKAKSILCNLSIEYEQTTAKKYCTTDEQNLLKQIESKNVQHMTSLFAGFRPIFKKMKALKQPFLTKTTFFCQCGGVTHSRNDFYEIKNETYQITQLPQDLKQVVTVIEVYQYPGPLQALQQKLQIPETATDIPHKFRKACACKNPTQEQPIQAIEEALMAFFAQHPQFTNGAEIKWKELGLEHSDLKKEYDYLLTLPGFSRKDMSIFHINHMFASTIADALKEDSKEESVDHLQAKS